MKKVVFIWVKNLVKKNCKKNLSKLKILLFITKFFNKKSDFQLFRKQLKLIMTCTCISKFIVFSVRAIVTNNHTSTLSAFNILQKMHNSDNPLFLNISKMPTKLIFF